MAWSNRNSIAKQRTWFILSIFIPKTIPHALLFLDAVSTGWTKNQHGYYLVRISLSMNILSNVSNNFILDFNCKLHVIPMTSLMNRYFFSDTYYVCSVHWFVLYHIVKINTCGYLPHSKAQRFITFLMIVILS